MEEIYCTVHPLNFYLDSRAEDPDRITGRILQQQERTLFF
jgi:hypothetical protein